MKRPAFQFYPADWQKDPALQSCSIAARGMWIELMCIAHQADPYGYVCINGKAATPAQIARLVGESVSAAAALMSELLDAGVYSADGQGRIFSRRMVKDERLRNVRAESGRLGGNPALVGNRVKQTDNQQDNHKGEQKPTPSSSSSSSTSGKPKPLAQAPAMKVTSDPEKLELWEKGKGLLTAQGVSIDAAGALLGKIVKEYGQKLVLSLVREASASPPADFKSWLVAACQQRGPSDKGGAWWASESATTAKGAQYGLTPHNGEGWPEFRQRINRAIEAEKRKAA